MATTKATKAKQAQKKGAKAGGKKTAAKRKPTPNAASKRAADRADKSVEDFREALERSVTLSRDRIQEVVDDAVKRGRMTRADANDLVGKLVARGRKQTDELLKELEKALEAARKDLEGRAKRARKGVESRTDKVRKTARKQTKRATKAVVDAADEPLAQADKLRSRAGAPGFPITAYDELTAAQIKSRVGDLTKADARKVRTHEKNNKARKSILDAVEKRLAG